MAHCKAEITFRMTRTAIYFVIFFFIVCSTVDAWGRGSKQIYSRGGRSYNDNYQQKSANVVSNQKNTSKTKSSGGGIGAWGYVAIILTLICTGMGVYYFTLFYPILCKKERKYDVMEMGSVSV